MVALRRLCHRLTHLFTQQRIVRAETRAPRRRVAVPTLGDARVAARLAHSARAAATARPPRRLRSRRSRCVGRCGWSSRGRHRRRRSGCCRSRCGRGVAAQEGEEHRRRCCLWRRRSFLCAEGTPAGRGAERSGYGRCRQRRGRPVGGQGSMSHDDLGANADGNVGRRHDDRLILACQVPCLAAQKGL